MNNTHKFNILYLSYNPINTLDFTNRNSIQNNNLDLNYEAAYINGGIEQSREASFLSFQAFYNTSMDLVPGYLDTFQPQILHFALRKADNQIQIPDKNSNKTSFSHNEFADKLIQILNTPSGSYVKILFLRIFETKEVADMIHKAFPNLAIIYLGNSKQTASVYHEFVSSFYQLLGNSMKLTVAFSLAQSLSAIKQPGLLTANQTGEFLIPDTGTAHCDSLLFASTQATKGNPLACLGQEMDSISGHPQGTGCKALYPFSKRDILMALTYYTPKYVVFTSHGSLDHVFFYNENQEHVLVDKDWLSATFSNFRDSIECVLFSSCENMSIAHDVSKHISHVIGTSKPVIDSLAALVTKTFFSLLFENCKEIVDYDQTFERTISLLKNDPGLDKKQKKNLNVYLLFNRSDFTKKSAQEQYQQMLFDRSKERALKNWTMFSDNIQNDSVYKQIEQNFPEWIKQFSKKPAFAELLCSLFRLSVYISFKDIFLFLTENYQSFLEYKLEQRIAYLPFSNDEDIFSDPSSEYWMLFKYITSVSPDRTWLNFSEASEAQLKEIFDIVLIGDFLSSGKKFTDYMEKNLKYLKHRRITLIVLCSTETAEDEAEKYIKKTKLDVEIIVYKKLIQAFNLYPKYSTYRRTFKTICKNLNLNMNPKLKKTSLPEAEWGMPLPQILGKNQAEALCFLYNTVPQETLGIFTWKSDHYKPLVSLSECATTKAPTLEEKSITLEEKQDQLSAYLSGKFPLNFHDMSYETGYTMEELRKILDSLVRKPNNSGTKTAMYQALYILIIKYCQNPQFLGNYPDVEE